MSNYIIFDSVINEYKNKKANTLNQKWKKLQIAESQVIDFDKMDIKVNQQAVKIFEKQKTSSDIEKSTAEYHQSLREKSKKQSKFFINMLKNDNIEHGFFSSSEIYLKSKLMDNPYETKDWLNRILIDNMDKPDIIVKLLHIISDIDYQLIEPQGPTLALAASRHPDSEVQEYSIRVFEKWGNEDSLNLLKNIRFQEEWLQDYADEVMEDLKGEFI